MRYLALALALVSCGDPLADGHYLGEPLYRLEGWVELELSPDALTANDTQGELRVAVFWAPARGENFRLDIATEQAVETTGFFPAKFEITLYEPPDPSLYRTIDDGKGELAVALLLAYLDVDKDGRWDRDTDWLVGGARDQLLAYTPTGLESPTWGRIPTGFAKLVATNSDCSAGPILFKADDSRSMDLVVGLQFPTEVLLDRDCDGGQTEWTGLCPALSHVRKNCRESGTPDTYMCPACEPLLWPVGADHNDCGQWFQRCLEGAPAHECEFEYNICAGKAPPPPDPECNLQCVCESLLSRCYEANNDDPRCKDSYYECIGEPKP
jgi:hypothetical protein